MNRALFSLLLSASLGLTGVSHSFAEGISDYYKVEDIPTPPGVVPECGGIAFLPNGSLVAAFQHGEVFIYNPASKEWKQFAEGLHCPMGVLAISEREIIVTQRPELTRLIDTDGDGVADRYECLSDGWGISGNYHEFVFNPVQDKEGNIYVGLGNGSNDGVARYEVRGKFSPDGYVHSSHFSCVPYRGWVVKVASDGQVTPVASGFRQPNGLVLDPENRLFTTDNQGDWVGTSKLHYIQTGRFYGHAPGLVWREDFQKGRSVDELDKLRTEGAVLFSHAILANSPGQPVFDLTHGKFGPFAGQMIVTEFNIPRLLRVMLDTVHGQIQGATTPLYDGPPLRMGGIRLAFAPDGSLWSAQSERKQGWPAGAGIQRISWTGKTPLDVQEIHLTKTGFDLTFTTAVDPASVKEATAYKMRRYYYEYHEEYGSPQMDVHDVKVTATRISANGRQVSLDVDTLVPGYIYEFTFQGIKARDGSPLMNTLLGYTANTLVDGSVAPIPRPAPTGPSIGSGHDKPRAGTE